MTTTNDVLGLEKRRRDLLVLLRSLSASAMAYQQACDKQPTETGFIRNKTDLANTSRAFRRSLRAIADHCGHRVSRDEMEWVLDYYQNTPPWGKP